MRRYLHPVLAGLTGFLLLSLLSLSELRADVSIQTYKALGLRVADVLTGSVFQVQVRPDAGKEIIAVVTAFTGKKKNDEAVEVYLAVFRETEGGLEKVYLRQFREQAGGPVAHGELQLLDFDGDGIQEIILTYEVQRSPLIREREAEVIYADKDGFHTAWKGLVLYDATRAAREVPPERRDHFEREVDIAETMRTRAVTLFLKKTVRAVAGEQLESPKEILESFPLKEKPEDW